MYVSGTGHSFIESKICGTEQSCHSGQLQKVAQYRRVQSFVLSQAYDYDLIAKSLSGWRDTGSEWMDVSLPREQNLVATDITTKCALRLSLADRLLLLALDGKDVMIVRDGMLNSSRTTL